jgi:F0F1-type ATP synthase beta subunit
LSVSLRTIEGFRQIINGEYDDIPEEFSTWLETSIRVKERKEQEDSHLKNA